MSDTQQFRLAWLGEAGPAGWDDPARPATLDWTRPEPYVEMARVLDNAGVDFVLFDDAPAIPGVHRGSRDALVERGFGLPRLDAAVLAPMLAVHTRSIGFVPTLSTRTYAPYLLARLLATLDHVTGGRIGWNVSTAITPDAADVFGLPAFGLPDVPAGAADDDLVDEYLQIVTGLFAGWEPDALVLDVEAGVFADPAKVHALDFAGRYFRVRGPLNIVPSPQGRPLIVTGDVSPGGLRRAGRYADVVVAASGSVDDMRAVRAEARAAAVDAGRDPDELQVLFLVEPLIARTDSALAAATAAVPPADRLERGLAWLSAATGVDMAGENLDRPPRAELTAGGGLSLRHVLAGRATAPLREIAEAIGAGATFDLHGSHEALADRLEELFDAVGGDGFVIRGRWTPTHVTAIADQLVGELRRRGRVAPPATGSTLRRRVTADEAGAIAR